MEPDWASARAKLALAVMGTVLGPALPFVVDGSAAAWELDRAPLVVAMIVEPASAGCGPGGGSNTIVWMSVAFKTTVAGIWKRLVTPVNALISKVLFPPAPLTFTVTAGGCAPDCGQRVKLLENAPIPPPTSVTTPVGQLSRLKEKRLSAPAPPVRVTFWMLVNATTWVELTVSDVLVRA